MEENLKTLINLNLDLGLFYNVSISRWDIILQSHNVEDLRNYLLSKGFVKYNYLYAEDNTENAEYQIEELNVRVILIGTDIQI
jgi:hypothetical protein